jgi:hypothetical protein
MTRIDRYVRGTATFRSALFSRTWTFTQDGRRIAVAVRHPWRRISEITLDDGTVWQIRPAGWGHLELHGPDGLLAEATRLTWTGRTWELFSPRFSYILRARSPILRTWSLDIVDAPVAGFRGGKLTFNRLTVTAETPIPLEAVLLTWHIVVRSWEAASAATGGSA